MSGESPLEAWRQCQETGQTVKTEFNGTPVLCQPGESVELVQMRWQYERLLIQIALGVIRVEDVADMKTVRRDGLIRGRT